MIRNRIAYDAVRIASVLCLPGAQPYCRPTPILTITCMNQSKLTIQWNCVYPYCHISPFWYTHATQQHTAHRGGYYAVLFVAKHTTVELGNSIKEDSAILERR